MCFYHAAGSDQHLTQNVASIPFRWILPLALYLLTFILASKAGAGTGGMFMRLAAVALGGMTYRDER